MRVLNGMVIDDAMAPADSADRYGCMQTHKPSVFVTSK